MPLCRPAVLGRLRLPAGRGLHQRAGRRHLQGFECPDVPGLDDFLEAADANNDNMLNSDEFNSAFQESMDEITPDGQLDRNELAAYVCQKKKAKAAAAAAAHRRQRQRRRGRSRRVPRPTSGK